MRGRGIGLQKGLADRGSNHRVLALRDMRQGVAHPMYPTPLPRGVEHTGDGMTQAVVRVRDHQLDALEATLDQALQEARPERLGFRGTEAEADDLAPAIRIDGHGD